MTQCGEWTLEICERIMKHFKFFAKIRKHGGGGETGIKVRTVFERQKK